MRKYENQTIEVIRLVEVSSICDRCGINKRDTDFDSLIPVEISINEDEEMGGKDYLDFCDDCIVALAPHFVAIGCKIEMVTGERPPEEESLGE